MGIRQLTDHGAKTAGGELVFFMVKPDNLSVLSGEGIRSRVKNLTDLLCGTQEVRLPQPGQKSDGSPVRHPGGPPAGPGLP